MGRDNRGRCSRSTRRFVKLDLAAHGVALVSCATGGIVLESVILMGAASHHVASIGFRLYSKEMADEQTRSGAGDAMFSAVQLILWTCCLVLAICVTAQGAHGLFHAESLDAMAMAGFAAPGAVAAGTTAALTRWSVHGGHGSDRVDALLSAVPTVAALCVAFGDLGADAGRLDALAGLAIVLMLCARTVIYLGRALD
ncbi:hypothetical protein [Massilia sp. H6]|uniref:hypothetical protein n=1 Tax=Massilia sp. H6 TaxID=2970464 RepID=UPI0021677D2D|nr:hypothetical protein [Massilia sp. H6]UVW30512.1 hypothetical protein NRS07_19510 [Massilia sp. H6]